MLNPREGVLNEAPGTSYSSSNTGTPSPLQLSGLTLAFEAGRPLPKEMVTNLARMPHTLSHVTRKPRVLKTEKAEDQISFSASYFSHFLVVSRSFRIEWKKPIKTFPFVIKFVLAEHTADSQRSVSQYFISAFYF